MKKKYNREKTLAIVTGIVCALIFLAGTTLGGIHSMMALGGLGILSVACYLIADSAIIWGAYIDYHEDKNAMAWTAMAVKYILSAYILFSGGCIAWLMIAEGKDGKAQTARTSAYQDAYDKCMKDTKQPAACRKMATELLKNETEVASTDKKAADTNAGFVKTYVDFPLFKYLPGILGLFGLFTLALVSKLAPQDEDIPGMEMNQDQMREFMNWIAQSNQGQPVHFQPSGGLARIVQQPSNAPFTVGQKQMNSASLPSVSNGLQGVNAAAFRFKAHGRGVQITWRRSKKELSCCSVSIPEANVMTTMGYDQLAYEIIKRRRAKNANDPTANEIQATVTQP